MLGRSAKNVVKTCFLENAPRTRGIPSRGDCVEVVNQMLGAYELLKSIRYITFPDVFKTAVNLVEANFCRGMRMRR